MKRLSFLKVIGVGAAAIAAPSVFINKENTKFIDSDSLKDGYKSKWDSSPTTIPAYSQFDKNVISTAYFSGMCEPKIILPNEDGSPKHTCKTPYGGVKGELSGVWYFGE